MQICAHCAQIFRFKYKLYSLPHDMHITAVFAILMFLSWLLLPVMLLLSVKCRRYKGHFDNSIGIPHLHIRHSQGPG